MTEKTTFEKSRIKDLVKIYSDPTAAKFNYNKSATLGWQTYDTAEALRNAIKNAINSKDALVNTSEGYYTTNPIYASVLNYLANMFLWRYTVIPHKLYAGSSRKVAPKLDKVYSDMMEVVEGLNLENKIPAELLQLFIDGSVFFTTEFDSESQTINTLLLPNKYCRKVGETQFGTGMIKFDYSYFDNQGLSPEQLVDFLSTFPEEMQEGYAEYKRNANNKWQDLDPHYSSCVMLNEKGVPNLIYVIGSILNYEGYGDNELKRNKNLLKYMVVHKMPLYQDQLIFSTEETQAIHKSLAKVVNTGEDVRLITTFGDVDLLRVADSDTTENKALTNAYQAIFNNVGLNNVLFTGQSVEALKYSLRRDQSMVWSYVEQLMNFYNMAINNWCDFKGYQAEIQMLRISHYSYEEDVKSYRENATLGVGKLDYLVAAGIKQKNIQDRIELENFLQLDQLKPLQTSYTQAPQDRADEPSAKEDSGSSSVEENNVKDDEENDDGKNQD